MEYIKTFEQHSNSELILEKLDYNKVEEYVKKIGSNPNIIKVVEKMKKYLLPLYKNYTSNGVIQSDKLYNDLKTLSLNTSEEFDFYDNRREYDYNTGRYVDVKDIDGERIEVWSTSDKSYVEGIGVGDTLYLTNFSFSGKVKSGE